MSVQWTQTILKKNVELPSLPKIQPLLITVRVSTSWIHQVTRTSVEKLNVSWKWLMGLSLLSMPTKVQCLKHVLCWKKRLSKTWHLSLLLTRLINHQLVLKKLLMKFLNFSSSLVLMMISWNSQLCMLQRLTEHHHCQITLLIKSTLWLQSLTLLLTTSQLL